MKRTNHLIERIADPENLRLAFWKARKGKSEAPEVGRYRRHLDANLLELRNEILSGEVRVGGYRYFTIYDPKLREICAASFRERVLHHALISCCHDTFEKYQIFDSYACRLGKGTYAALDRAAEFQHQYRWFLKLDVRKYFNSIDHDRLKELLACRFKERALLDIFGSIVDSYRPTATGVPIGNLTSQYFANHYLGLADHHVKETLRAPAYVRYMDDMVIWTNDKAQLLDIGHRFEAFIAQTLRLTLKPFCLNSADKGLPFLGYLLFPDKIRLQQRSKRRFIAKLTGYTEKLNRNTWGQQEYQQHLLPLLAFVRRADTVGLRRRVMAQRVAAEMLEPRESRRQLEQLGIELSRCQPQQQFAQQQQQQFGLPPCSSLAYKEDGHPQVNRLLSLPLQKGKHLKTATALVGLPERAGAKAIF
jgi:retron-type reverse transcriptase